MSITSPAEFLKDLDLEFFKRYRPLPDTSLEPIDYVEPDLTSNPVLNKTAPTTSAEAGGEEVTRSKIPDKITSKVVALGDFIDTDAVSRLRM